MKLYYKITTIAFIMIFIGMTLTLERIIEDNEIKEEIINNQIKEITELRKKCK